MGTKKLFLGTFLLFVTIWIASAQEEESCDPVMVPHIPKRSGDNGYRIRIDRHPTDYVPGQEYRDVDFLPEFDTQLIPEGTTKAINCTYPAGEKGSNSTPSLHWLKPSLREIPADGTKRVRVEEQRNLLVFDPIKKSDEGNYTCVSSNIAGETTRILQVVVATVPQITNKPSDVHIKDGEEAILRCNANGTPTPNISWMMGNKDVSNKQGIEITADGSLVISSAITRHNGTYTCAATTIAGTKTASATIFVKAILKFNPRPIAVTSLDRGEVNRLICHATASTPPYIKWYKQGLIGSWPAHITEPDSGVLEFNPAEASDAGIYRCIASTGLESINSTVRINVVVKPKFVIIPNNTVGFEGYSLKIDCTAYGDPAPTITWISKQIANNPEHFTHLPNGTLLIREVHANDAGRYHCIAGSDAGLNTTEITLSVQSTDVQTMPPKRRASRDCRMSDWGPWSECTVTCGMGIEFRMRDIERRARGGGAPCDPLKEMRACNAGLC